MSNQINFKVALKTFLQEGHLAWEYNPFHNYRLDRDVFYYNGLYIEVEDFIQKYTNSLEEDLELVYREGLGIYKVTKKEKVEVPEGKTREEVYESLFVLINIIDIKDYLKDKTKTIQFYKKGQLVDFITEELHFDLSNPVNITPLWSYDNSVNLIINDGKNPPRLINSRFSPTERNEYLICDRKGNNDTNIYDLGEQFDIDTSLYKKTTTIPKLDFMGVTYGGNLSIGNYHFYFKYIDEDGNESDFFAESGLVSIFIGNSADSIHTGFRNENSHKLVKFLLSNTDVSYNKIVVYYTKATSDIFENATVSAFKIEDLFSITNHGLITITGFEPVTEVTLDDINMQYLVYGSVETQATCLNMLFLANVDRPKIDYDDLADCALRFLPTLHTERYNISQIGNNYQGPVKDTYYDPNFIYNKVGYWDDEIYRFGVVFIKSDNTLTEVFNVRGRDNLEINSKYSFHKFYSDKNRQYINYDEYTYNIISGTNKTDSIYDHLENAKGVVRINHSDYNNIIGFNFKVDKEVIEYLQNKHKIKGLFFVRQKRIPTTLCLAYTIAVDNQSHTPVLPTGDPNNFITEGFLGLDKVLYEDFESRKKSVPRYQCREVAAICPDYDVNSPYLNTLFSASEHSCRFYLGTYELNQKGLQLTPSEGISEKDTSYRDIKVIGVEDNVKLVAINDSMFSARAGEAEEGFRYEYLGTKKVDTDNTDLLRASYGPYLGLTGLTNKEVGRLMDIKIPGFNIGDIDDYFSIRYNDKSPYYAISDRLELDPNNILIWNEVKETIEESEEPINVVSLRKPIFRGDCYICLFTHRFNRNFQDPSAPTNDVIIDPDCWKNNFAVEDGIVKKENFDKINLGDLNAVPIGLYITLTVRSSMNLNIRSLDDSIVDEVALVGHPRGFYPYHPLTTAGSYKTPEALCYNKGFEKSVSERYNMELPDVPWIKNEFSNRIAYSNIQVNDAFLNGWRTYMGLHYRDYPKTYGSITKLIELGGNLLCVFEHGIGLIPVNERAIAGEGAGGPVYIDTSNVLPENPKIISDKFGSLWRESIIKTPTAVYGVDTIAKKIWKTNGDTIEYISDFRILEFLNNNITLNERELTPVIGIRNVKTHYNAFKGDVMFTFYDNLHGFSERVWNLCWNEKMLKWITFYSWIPSYSENIYNSYFSFDRNTSKWIAKLGISKTGNDFSDGVTLSNVVIEPYEGSKEYFVGYLSLSNRSLPENSVNTIEYSLERDNYGNYKYFNVRKITKEEPIPEDLELKKLYEKNELWGLFIRERIESHYNPKKETIEYSDLCSELYVREHDNSIINDPKEDSRWKISVLLSDNYYDIYKDDKGRRMNLKDEYKVNPDKIVRLLNIKASIKSSLGSNDVTADEALATGEYRNITLDAGYYKSTIAIIPKYNLLFLSTDFWKHGQAGIIDIADKIYPTYWYGKLHPFEFEFVVNDNPDAHKIFDNLEFISNKAAPESFHYEIVGECYDFAKDKKNMYIRLEATKELYLYNGEDIEFDTSYKTLNESPRSIETGKDIEDNLIYTEKYYDKSTIFPQWYYRKNTINEIEDSYHLLKEDSKRFDLLAGAEIVKYDNLDEYRIWNHAKATNMAEGRLRGNMYYSEDKWKIQINPINLVLKNEEVRDWDPSFKLENSKAGPMIPAELNHFNVLNKLEGLENTDNNRKLYLPPDWERSIVKWKEYEELNNEVKIKDKFVKIRVRYSGEDLAIISAIKTLYRISHA